MHNMSEMQNITNMQNMHNMYKRCFGTSNRLPCFAPSLPGTGCRENRHVVVLCVAHAALGVVLVPAAATGEGTAGAAGAEVAERPPRRCFMAGSMRLASSASSS